MASARLRLGERFLLSSGVTRITLGGGGGGSYGDVICLAGPPWSGMGWGNKTKCKNKETPSSKYGEPTLQGSKMEPAYNKQTEPWNIRKFSFPRAVEARTFATHQTYKPHFQTSKNHLQTHLRFKNPSKFDSVRNCAKVQVSNSR